jgi:hypothetical protein
MSDVVVVALITGGFTLVAPLAALWLNRYAEREKTRLEFKASMKAKLMDYEREDRLAAVRPIREFLSELGSAITEITLEAAKTSLPGSADSWALRLSAHRLRGFSVGHSIDDDDLCTALELLSAKVHALAEAGRDFLKAPAESEQCASSFARIGSITGELSVLLRDIYAKLDRYARQVGIPTLND